MTDPMTCSIIEGLLYVSGEEGVAVNQVAKVLDDCAEQDIHRLIKHMKQSYDDDPACGLTIVDTPSGYRLTTKPSLASYVECFAAIPKASPLSQAALETVAIIAYRQPVSRIEIDDIRGVKSDRALHSLLLKGMICEKGRADSVGRAILYGVTPLFLDYFGFRSLDELPPLFHAAQTPNEQLDAYDLFYDKYKETLNDLETQTKDESV
ncbi:MAG: SMC-Scp complex subunit ScpB [Sporolactobacillus sp.]